MRSILAFLLIILLTSCSYVPEFLVAPGGVIYQDDFSDPGSGWLRSADETGSLDYTPAGHYELSVKTPQYDIWAVSGHTFGDVRVEADASRLAGPDINRYGLICRYTSPQDFYFFVITSDGYEGIGKVSQGKRIMLDNAEMEYNPAVVVGDGPNHIQFDCIGPQLTGSVNGQIVAEATDPDLTKGDAGLIAGAFEQPGVIVAFDNFIVCKP
jgi:hypothetical protein